jgi:hypothetical protein
MLELLARRADGSTFVVEDGGEVPLVLPPQGGRVLFIGVRAKSFPACGVQLSGVLRDEPTGQITLESRTVNLEPRDGDWAGSVDALPDTFSNLPVCPNSWSSRDAFGEPYELTISLSTEAGDVVSKTVHVTPVCSADDPECTCICDADYVLGDVCGGAI